MQVTEEDFLQFIGQNADDYLPKFRKFNLYGYDKFALTWHWEAFFFTIFWMAYRKLYAWALATALGMWGLYQLLAIPDISIHGLRIDFITFMALNGIGANYLYYKHAKKKIIKLKSPQTLSDSHQMAVALQKKGGVNVWAPILLLIGIFFVMCLEDVASALYSLVLLGLIFGIAWVFYYFYSQSQNKNL